MRSLRSRAIGSVIDSAMRGGAQDQRHGPGPFYFLIVIVLKISLGLLANIVVMWFSRQREFRADAGGARLSGTHLFEEPGTLDQAAQHAARFFKLHLNATRPQRAPAPGNRR